MDGAGHRGAQSLPAGIVGHLAGESAEVLDADRAAGAEDRLDRQRGFYRPAGSQGLPAAHAGQDRCRRVRLEPHDDGHVDIEQLAYLTGDHRQDLVLPGRTGDEHRHAPQRGLLVRYPAKVGLRLGVRDGGRDELGQARDAPLTPGLEPPRP